MMATEEQAVVLGLAIILAYVGLILYVLLRSARLEAAPKDKENHL